ncbi:MAG: hypothetical protein AB9M53_00720 [Leptothrix sp. (in: b-proteobacteria)]
MNLTPAEHHLKAGIQHLLLANITAARDLRPSDARRLDALINKLVLLLERIEKNPA